MCIRSRTNQTLEAVSQMQEDADSEVLILNFISLLWMKKINIIFCEVQLKISFFIYLPIHQTYKGWDFLHIMPGKCKKYAHFPITSP